MVLFRLLWLCCFFGKKKKKKKDWLYHHWAKFSISDNVFLDAGKSDSVAHSCESSRGFAFWHCARPDLLGRFSLCFPCRFSPRSSKVEHWSLNKADIRGVNLGSVSVAAVQPFLCYDEISGIWWQRPVISFHREHTSLLRKKLNSSVCSFVCWYTFCISV